MQNMRRVKIKWFSWPCVYGERTSQHMSSTVNMPLTTLTIIKRKTLLLEFRANWPWSCQSRFFTKWTSFPLIFFKTTNTYTHLMLNMCAWRSIDRHPTHITALRRQVVVQCLHSAQPGLLHLFVFHFVFSTSPYSCFSSLFVLRWTQNHHRANCGQDKSSTWVRSQQFL